MSLRYIQNNVIPLSHQTEVWNVIFQQTVLPELVSLLTVIHQCQHIKHTITAEQFSLRKKFQISSCIEEEIYNFKQFFFLFLFG